MNQNLWKSGVAPCVPVSLAPAVAVLCSRRRSWLARRLAGPSIDILAGDGMKTPTVVSGRWTLSAMNCVMFWIFNAVRVLSGISRGGRGPYLVSASTARPLAGPLWSGSVHPCVSEMAVTNACVDRVVPKHGPASPLFIVPRRRRCRGGPAAAGR